MKRMTRIAMVAAGLMLAAGSTLAADVKDGNAVVQPRPHDRYAIDGYIMGKAELFGYISDLKDREHLTGVVLDRGGDAEQVHAIGSIAKSLKLNAYEQDGGSLKPIAN